MEARGKSGGVDGTNPTGGGLPDGSVSSTYGALSDLEGVWRVERTEGLLPPMVGVWKRIEGARGETRVGPLVGWPFGVERRREGFALVYRPPFSAFVDEVRPGPGDS